MKPEMLAILLENAVAARRFSHCPISGFAVGVAMADEDGTVWRGTNVEEPAFNGTIHAEAAAIGAMIADRGMRRVTDLVVVCESADGSAVPPCGHCRQLLAAVADDHLAIVCASSDGSVRLETTLGELLPRALRSVSLGSGAKPVRIEREVDAETDDEPEAAMPRHEPLVPPRRSVYGEGVYLRLWQALMLEEPRYGNGSATAMFDDVLGEALSDSGCSTERDAAVAASFITWLGTNGGASYLRQASLREGESAYFIEWCLANRRRPRWNGGSRRVEVVLAEPGPPTVSTRDVEVVEAVAAWLGSSRGRRFLADAEREMQEVGIELRARDVRRRRVKQAANEAERAHR